MLLTMVENGSRAVGGTIDAEVINGSLENILAHSNYLPWGDIRQHPFLRAQRGMCDALLQHARGDIMPIES